MKEAEKLGDKLPQARSDNGHWCPSRPSKKRISMRSASVLFPLMTILTKQVFPPLSSITAEEMGHLQGMDI